MDLGASVQNYIYGAANAKLSAAGLGGTGSGTGMGLGYSLSASASSSATATGKSGDISGGTAFNIGGINFGTVSAPTTAEGGTPANSIAGVSNQLSALALPLLAGAALVVLVLFLRK